MQDSPVSISQSLEVIYMPKHNYDKEIKNRTSEGGKQIIETKSNSSK